MRTFLRACVLGLILVSICVTSFSQQVAKSIPNSSTPEGLIGFLEFKPSDYGSQKHPLIIFLHGIGERGNGTSQLNAITANAIPNYCAHGASMRFTVNGQTSSFVVLSPQLSTQFGYWPTFYVTELIKYAKANLQIDPNRIYLAGLSLGGGGVWRAITDVPNWTDFSFDGTIAAAAPVCGTQEENDGYFCNTIGANHLPVWNFHCMDDGTVNVGASQHAEILGKNCGITPAIKFTYYLTGGHSGAWLNAFDTGHITRATTQGNFTPAQNMYEWFLSNTRSGAQGAAAPSYTAPVANAGASQSITLPVNLITLSGSGTGTNGATISSYSWSQTSGPSNGTITLPLLNTTLVTGLVQGTYVFTLTVTDNHGLTSSSNVTVTVNPLAAAPANKIPTANAGSDQTITLPTNSVVLDGSASYDPDGYITTYRWTQTDGPVGPAMSARDSKTTSVTGLVQGNYTFVLQITDNVGAVASTSVNLTVNPGKGKAKGKNNYPIADPGADITITLPTNTVTLSGMNSYDTDGYLTGYRWTQTAGPVGPQMSDRNNGTTAVTGLVAGNYTFVLEVTDDDGAIGSASMQLTVNPAVNPPSAPAPPAGPVAGQPIGYIKQSRGYYQACDDGSSDGRMPIYASSIANGSVVYQDAAMTNSFNGGYNWFSFTPTIGSSVTKAFAIFPDGVMHLVNNCGAGGTTNPNQSAGNLLGYIKISTGPYEACDDASSNNRMAIYGTSLGNGANVYTDAAMTQKFDGGWNWYSLTPTLGGQVTTTLVIYPIGIMGMLRDCSNGGARSIAGATTNTDNSALQGLSLPVAPVKLGVFPNPVRNTATVQLNSQEDGMKTINVYNSNGVLVTKYNWQTVKGNNTFLLNKVSGLAGGLYIADIRDSNGKPVGTVKFVKE